MTQGKHVMSTEFAHFNCEHCGKQYAWKPSIAGKRAKCACGQTIQVPEAIEAEDGLYDFAEPLTPARRPAASIVIPPVNTESASQAAVLPYGSRRTAENERGGRFDDFYHAPRDFYWPSGVLAAGFIALLAWAATAGASGGVLVVFTVYITIVTLIKTGIMIGAAFIIAPLAGISFGTLWTAILKLAAIVVMTDAALFWLQAIMEYTGAYPGAGAGRRVWMLIGLVNTLLAGAIIAILSKIFFDMDIEEVGTFAIPMAILNRVLNFILMLILAGILDSL
jgi:hypothetical protein